MTWTLRLYDGDGVEIATVTADPYSYQITHPDAGWDGLAAELEGYGDGQEALAGEQVIDEGFTVRFDNVEYHDETPEEHLEWVRDEMLLDPEVDSASLADE